MNERMNECREDMESRQLESVGKVQTPRKLGTLNNNNNNNNNDNNNYNNKTIIRFCCTL